MREYNFATCPGGRSIKITRECWEQHVEEGTFNFSSSRKYTTQDCGEIPSFKVNGKKIATPAHSTSVNAATSGRLSEWPAQERRNTVCAQHAPDGMVDVKKRKCITEGCGKEPSSGVEGTTTAEYYTQHAPDGMVNVRYKMGSTDHCGKYALFGVVSTKTVEYCAQHSPDGMVNVKSRTCSTAGCSKQQSFGVAGMY